jgi:Protein of unknown function (DUF3105)
MSRTPSNQRVTKAERKEQARRQRIELQRKAARSRRNRRIIVIGLAVLVAGVAVFAFTRPGTEVPSPQELLANVEDARTRAGCGEIQDVGAFQPRAEDRAHVPAEGMPPLANYPSTPPASGPHNEITFGAGVYSTAPPIERVLHSLEHGAAVVWYAPDASGVELDRIQAFYEDEDVGGRVIVAPYDYPEQGAAGVLPAGARMSLVSWHHVQSCEQLDLAAAFGFTSGYAAPPFGQERYRGNAPEAGARF